MSFYFIIGGICSPKDYPEFHDCKTNEDETCAYCNDKKVKQSISGELICAHHWDSEID